MKVKTAFLFTIALFLFLPYHLSAEETPLLKWKKASEFCIKNTPALGDDGLFYTAAGMGIVAIDPTDGSVVWGPIIPPGCSSYFGGYGVSVGANGLIYAVGDWNSCRNGRLVAFHNYDGSIVWDHGDCPGVGNTSPHPRQTPALNEALNSLHFGSSCLCSVDMCTGDNNWSASGGRYIGEGGIAIDSLNNVYYGTNNGAGGTNLVRSYSSGGSFRWGKIIGDRGSKIM